MLQSRFDRQPMSVSKSKQLLVLAAVLTVVAWQFPIGQQILYPFTLLATYAHEMGHGLTAVLVGADFHSLEMHFDGSGLARWSGDVGRIGRAMIAAGGLVGPSIAGAIILIASRRTQRARTILIAIAAIMLLTLVLYVRSVFGLVFVAGIVAALAGVAKLAPRAAPFLVQLIGVQLAISVFRDVHYMFSEGALVDGVLRKSDSAAIADALLLPYWFWGALTAAFAFAVLGVGLYIALRPTSRPVAARA
jgi:hypothetical protein